jgi:hypothetical protein
LGENDLEEETYASLAVAGNQLFLRTVNNLWCVEEASGNKGR